MSYSGAVGAEDMKRCLGTVRDLMEQLKPGFFLLTDLTNLESMDAACAPDLGAIMELCSAKGMSTVVRVIPDPNKDIGFDLISHFHLHAPVKTQTHATLADAITSLLQMESPLDEPEPAPADTELARKSEDARADAHFTLATRKDAEVNEGGLVDADSV